MKPRLVKVEWRVTGSIHWLVIVSKETEYCLESYFLNGSGSFTALERTYKTAAAARVAIERKWLWRGK